MSISKPGAFLVAWSFWIIVFFILIFSFSQVSAQQDNSADKKLKHRSGYETDQIGTGGRSSVTRQLYLDDIVMTENLRFPEIDKSLQPYYEWKRGIRDRYDLQFGSDYTSLFQRASESLTAEDKAAGGVFRLYGRWIPLNKDKKNAGALVFKLEHSHNYGGSISPDELGPEIGYLGSTGTLYSDFDMVLNDLNWQQKLNDGQSEVIVGRLDVNDYMDVVDYANPWTTFQNSNILENHSIAIPETSFGFNLSHWLNRHWYLKAALTDANGRLDDVGVFEHGPEFFTYAELGWAPDSGQRELKGVHVTIWHVDERSSDDRPDGEGVAVGGSWGFDKKWVLFGRYGQSTGEASLMRRSTTFGVGHIFRSYFDVFGLAANYSEPVEQGLRDQTAVEAFLKFQLLQNLAITPSLQLLLNPALNPEHDSIGIVGLRLRATF